MPYWSMALTVAVAAYAAYFALYTSLVHMTYASTAYDLGTFDQEIWLAGHSFDHFVTVRGLHILGDHVRLFSFLLAPIYYVWDDVRMLLILQSVFVAGGAVFIWQIGRRELPAHPGVVLALCVGYLLNPAVQNMNLEQAHPEAFASVFILASIYYLRTERYVLFWIAAALAMSCKEDIPLVYLALGAYLLVSGQRRLGAALVVIAGAYFVVCMKVILPYFNDYGFFRDTVYFSEAKVLLHDPTWLAQRFIGDQARAYLFALGLPVAFVCLGSPAALIPALPALAANLLSDSVYTRSLGYHYTTSIMPFIYLASLSALAGLLGETSRSQTTQRTRPWLLSTRLRAGSVAALPLLVCAIAANSAYGRLPLTELDRVAEKYTLFQRSPGVRAIDEALSELPADAAVSADYSLLPHLAHRQWIYMFPNPFQAAYWGIKNSATHDPRIIEYVVIRTSLARQPRWRKLVASLTGKRGFERVKANNTLRVFKRSRDE